jgi:hypothetical protein
MAKLLKLRTFSDSRGNLSVIEDNEIPFPIKRLFYIYGVDASQRGGHRHKTTYLALISLKGICKAKVNNGEQTKVYVLDHPNYCLVLEPHDWHLLYDFSPDAIVLACASKYFDENDYIFDEYTDENTLRGSTENK